LASWQAGKYNKNIFRCVDHFAKCSTYEEVKFAAEINLGFKDHDLIKFQSL
jgi:hypothetical protein